MFYFPLGYLTKDTDVAVLFRLEMVCRQTTHMFVVGQHIIKRTVYQPHDQPSLGMRECRSSGSNY